MVLVLLVVAELRSAYCADSLHTKRERERRKGKAALLCSAFSEKNMKS